MAKRKIRHTFTRRRHYAPHDGRGCKYGSMFPATPMPGMGQSGTGKGAGARRAFLRMLAKLKADAHQYAQAA